jgi:hypothetical protein
MGSMRRNHREKTRYISGGFHMRKMVGCLFLFVISIGSLYSVDEYTIDETVKVYNANLRELRSEITYYPEPLPAFGESNAIVLYFSDFVNYAFIFGKNDRATFIEIIDKCIEWTEVAKKNGVHSLSKTIVEKEGIRYMMVGVSNYPSVFLSNFTFSIQEIDGKEEILLIINYRTIDQVNNGGRGSILVFKQNDFARLKEIFSEDYLLQFDKKAKEQAEIENLFQ